MDRTRAGEGQKERETQNPKQAPDSELSAQSPTLGSNSWSVRSQPELKSDVQRTEPPRCPDTLLTVHIGAHSLCYKLYGFEQMCNYTRPPLRYHTEWSHCPETPLCSPRSSCCPPTSCRPLVLLPSPCSCLFQNVT